MWQRTDWTPDKGWEPTVPISGLKDAHALMPIWLRQEGSVLLLDERDRIIFLGWYEDASWDGSDFSYQPNITLWERTDD